MRRYDNLEKQLGFNLLLDEPSLTKHDLEANRIVTLKVRDVSLKNALKLMLDTCELTYLVEHERVTVLPKLEANQRLETRIYLVRDLVVEKDDFENLITAVRASVSPSTWQSPQMVQWRRGDFQSTRYWQLSYFPIKRENIKAKRIT